MADGGVKETTPPHRVRHKKRGAHQTVLGSAQVQASTGPLAEAEAVTVYQGEGGRFEAESVLDELRRLGQEMGGYD